MSSMLIPVAMLGTFGAIILGGFALEKWLQERNRGVEALETQVGPVTTDLREVDLSRPFAERALAPFVAGLGSVARKITPADMRRRIARKIVLAGNPEGLDAEKVAAFKVFGAIGGVVLGLVLAMLAGLSGTLAVGAPVFLGAFGWLLPGAGLGQRGIFRQDSIRRSLADTIDLLTISVEAGLGFDAALAQVRQHVPGPLSEEISRMLQEMQIGVSRVEAFRQLAARTDVEELNAFVLAMIQADTFGVSIANVLRAQAKEMRMKRRQLAEEKAQRIAVKLLFPLIFCILPSMFIVVLGPGVIQFVGNFLGK